MSTAHGSCPDTSWNIVTCFRVQGVGFRVEGVGFRVEGVGFRV